MTRRPNSDPEEPDDVQIPLERQQFAANLARLRQARGWTQTDLAEKAGMRQPHISALERGTWEPRLATIMALLKALNVRPEALLPSFTLNKVE